MAFFQFVEKKGWKTFTARMYGWGASMVIIGALFKLQHWPFAGYMLTIGMGIECIIFFFSAFDPIPLEYHWDTVFPELGDGHGAATNKAAAGMQKRQGLDIDSDSAENLKRNVERFNQSLSSLGALATVAETSNRFVGGLQQAAGNMTVLNQTAQTFAAAYNETAQTIMAGGQQANVNLSTLNQTTQAFANAYNETAKTIAAGGQQASANLTALSQTTQAFAAAYNETAKTITAGGQQANVNLVALNKNLQAVNTSYELYMQEHKGYVEHSQKLLTVMDNSAKQSEQFDRQMIELNKLIAELNTAYVSVVNTVNKTLKRK
ncbi:MAG: gliding motility protein GldL [Prevotellaceae bacterium]|jgi:gliding motility-associated protein GldL|nr:gliding motility protein GldL [Prevotellaceae bacterium]